MEIPNSSLKALPHVKWKRRNPVTMLDLFVVRQFNSFGCLYHQCRYRYLLCTSYMTWPLYLCIWIGFSHTCPKQRTVAPLESSRWDRVPLIWMADIFRVELNLACDMFSQLCRQRNCVGKFSAMYIAGVPPPAISKVIVDVLPWPSPQDGDCDMQWAKYFCIVCIEIGNCTLRVS